MRLLPNYRAEINQFTVLSGVIFVVLVEIMFFWDPGISIATAQDPNNTEIIANTGVGFVYFLHRGSRNYFV